MKRVLVFFIIFAFFSGKNVYYDPEDAAHFKYYEEDENIIYWYEWWYANIKNEENGIVITFVTFGDLNNPLASIVGAYALFFSKNKFAESITSFPFIPYHLDYEKCNVSILNNRFYEEDGKYFVEYERDDLKIYLEIHPEGKKFGSFWKDGWQWMSWYVASPYGKGKARVWYKGEEYYFEGNAYHDHNWGIAKIYQLEWDWGEFNLGKMAIIYGFVKGEGGVHVVTQDMHVFIPAEKSRMEILDWERIGIAKKPKKILISANDKYINLEMNLELYKFYYVLKIKPYLLGRASGKLRFYNQEIIFLAIEGFYEHH